jgi:hypothetical protein
MITAVNANDPRVKRTRQLLLQAFISLLEEGALFTPSQCKTSQNVQRSTGQLFMPTLKTSMPS